MKKLVLLSLLLLMTVNGMHAQQKMSFSLVNPRISGSFYLYDLNATIGAGQTWSVGLSNIRVNFTSAPANALTVQADNPVLNANPNISNANGYFPMSTTSLVNGEAIALNILTFNSYGFYVFTEGTYLIGTLRWNIVTTPLTNADMYFRTAPSQFPSIVFDSLSQLALTTGDVTLNNPLNNSAGQPVNLTFKWFKATDKVLRASGVTLKSGFNTREKIDAGIINNKYGPNEISNYRFELATDTSFTNIVISDSSLTDTVKSVSSLSNLTNYYWRVKSKNGNGWLEYSSTWKFITIVALPAAPSLFTPANNSTGNPLNLNLVWSKPQYAAGYNVVLARDAGFSNIILNDSLLTDSVKAIVNLTPLTNYFWKVRAKNDAGWGAFSTTFTFNTIGVPGQVVLSYPVNNTVNLPVNLTFLWRKATDQGDIAHNIFNSPKTPNNSNTVSNYWFELASDSSFTNFIIRDSTLTDTTKSVTSLGNLTGYFWRVKAKNELGWGNFAAWFKFTTIPAVPAAPLLSSPLNGSTGNQLSLMLKWKKSAYATAYRLQLATDSLFNNIVLNDSTLTDSLRTVTGLNPLTTYYWRVNAANIAGTGVYSSVWNFRTIGTPTAVTLLSPANNAINQPVNLTFVWRKAVDQTMFFEQGEINPIKEQNPVNQLYDYNPYTVSNYWIEYGTDSTFAAVTGRDSTLTDTTKSVTGLSNLTNYYWRVKAKNQIGWASFSSVWKFTTIVSIPIAPVLLLPANNATGVSLTPLLDWNDVQYSASYRIQISADSLFITTLWDTSGVVPSQVNIPANKLTGLTKYYWRVNSTNAGGTGPYSTVWNFRTLQNLTLNLKVYLEGFWDGSTQVSDTTTVYLANTFTPFAFIDSAKVVLSTSGTYSVNFTKAPNASYYIVVNHRNHLETWSKLPQAFVTNVSVNYDFTTSANKAFGDNMKQVGSVWVLYGGDGNRDGSVDALDVGVFITQFGNSGYLSCDFNGDESVDALDVPIIIANFGLGKAIPTMDVQLPGNIKKEKVIEEIQKRFKLNGESDRKENFKKEK